MASDAQPRHNETHRSVSSGVVCLKRGGLAPTRCFLTLGRCLWRPSIAPSQLPAPSAGAANCGFSQWLTRSGAPSFGDIPYLVMTPRFVRPRALALLFALALLPAGACSTAAPLFQAGPAPDSGLMLNDVRYLASDSLEGRGTGTRGNDLARAYIAKRFADLKLKAVVPDSGCSGDGCSLSFVQPFVARMSGAERHGLAAALPTGNVVAMIQGRDPVLRHQYVVIGAHYDHLGRQAFGSRDTNLPDAIRNGADDNASGTAAVLELARLLKLSPPKRSIAIVAFSAEELGLLGAEHFVAHSPFAMDSVQAMLNFDMVGRLRNDKLIVYGTATATELPGIVSTANATAGFNLNAVGDGEGPSDHASFYRKNVPVLHFFTDVHDEYHKSTDDVHLINGQGMARIVAFAEDIARDLADRPGRLSFVRAPATVSRTSPSRSGAQPYFGSVPDMGASDIPGLRLSDVTTGSPADKGGLKAGDVVVEFGGIAVTDLQSYSDALYSRKPGDKVEVVVVRNGQRVTLSITLGQRGG